MRAEQKQVWGRFFSPLIRGGCIFLAVMAPLSCSKQENPDAQASTSDQAEVAGLKQQLAQLQANISKKNTELEKIQQQTAPVVTPPSAPGGNTAPAQAPAPSDSANSRPSVQQANRSVIEQDIVFQLKTCGLSGSLVKCDFLVTNKAGDRKVDLRNHERSRFIDDSGREYPSTSFALGAGVGTSVETTIPGDVSLRGQVQFDGVKPGTKKIQLLEMYCQIFGTNGWKDTVIKFSNVDL